LAKEIVHPAGLVFFEINEALGKDVANLLTSLEYSEVILKKDLRGRDRMIRAKLL
jgi:release factor glutamine methyltransferase